MPLPCSVLPPGKERPLPRRGHDDGGSDWRSQAVPGAACGEPSADPSGGSGEGWRCSRRVAEQWGALSWRGLGFRVWFQAFPGHVHTQALAGSDTRGSEGAGRFVQRGSSVCNLTALMEALECLDRSERGAEIFILLLHSLLQSAPEMGRLCS